MSSTFESPRAKRPPQSSNVRPHTRTTTSPTAAPLPFTTPGTPTLPRHLLTDDGRRDREHVYAFNVSNIGSTTSVKKRRWFRDMFASKPNFECLDRSIGDEASLARLSGQYLWNEDGHL